MSRKIQVLALVCAVFVAIGCLPAFAQGAGDQAATVDPATKAKVQEGLQKLATQLQLTDEQKAKIKPLLQEQVTQLKTVHDDTSLSADQRQAKMKEIHQNYHSQVMAVLTPEQQKKFAAMKEQKKQEMQK